MTTKICYWDSATQSQRYRDPTPAEAAEIEARRAGAPPDTSAQAVPMRSWRLALYGAGLLESYQAAVDAAPGADGEMLRIDWATAPMVDRAGRLAVVLAGMGKTPAEIDALFVAAAVIQ